MIDLVSGILEVLEPFVSWRLFIPLALGVLLFVLVMTSVHGGVLPHLLACPRWSLAG